MQLLMVVEFNQMVILISMVESSQVINAVVMVAEFILVITAK